MPAEIRYPYDDDLARRATRRFLSRYQRGTWWVVVVALLAAVLFALQRTWWLTSAFAVMALIYTTIRVKYRQRAILGARSLGTPEVIVTADAQSITFRLPDYQSTAQWTRARQLWQFDDVWIFLPFGYTASYTAVPTAAMTPEFREVVLAGMRAAGATVR